MHRIDTSASIEGRFVTGNPAVGQRATLVGSDWPNAVQEAICHVIERTGIVLVKGEDDQLYLAILDMISDAVAGLAAPAGGGGGAGAASVPITRVVHVAGMLQGGGPLGNDITVSLAKASGSDVLAGTDDTKAVTAKAIVDAMASVKAIPGYFRLPGGWLFQFGTGTATANGSTVLTLPIAFPTACAFAAVEGGLADPEEHDNSPYVSGKGTGSISVFNAVGANVPVTFFAFGY